jgi:hypothetical protein
VSCVWNEGSFARGVFRRGGLTAPSRPTPAPASPTPTLTRAWPSLLLPARRGLGGISCRAWLAVRKCDCNRVGHFFSFVVVDFASHHQLEEHTSLELFYRIDNSIARPRRSFPLSVNAP